MTIEHVQPPSGASRLALPQQPITRRRALQLGAYSAAAGLGLTALGAATAPRANAATIFTDNFDGPAWQLPNWGGWNFHTGPNDVNGELQYYTNWTDNVRWSGNGNLVIEARRNPWQVGGKWFTSGRLHSTFNFAFERGWVEARIRLPQGQGGWPAFWLLPTNEPNWPNGGEIDIMERDGRDLNRVVGSVHTPAHNWRSGGNFSGSTYMDNSAWHTFAVKKEPGRLTWFLDGRSYYQLDRSQVSDWPFDSGRRYYMILNLAVGGAMGHDDAAWNASWPQQMLVDRVLVNNS